MENTIYNEYGKIATDKDLNAEAVRLLCLIYSKIRENKEYKLSRKDMESEWCKIMGKTSQRKFCRGWNNLKDTYYLIPVRKGILKFWHIKSYEESMSLRHNSDYDNSESISVVGNEKNKETKNQCLQNVSDTQKKSKTNNRLIETNKDVLISLSKNDDIETNVKLVFDAYENGKTKKKVKIKNKIVKSKEISERFKEAREKGIAEKVISRVIRKINEYQGKIRYLASYIAASLYNTVQEWQEWEERELKRENEEKPIVSNRKLNNNATSMPIGQNKANKYNNSTINKYSTKFHNFEQRDTDYDSLLRKLNPSYF